MNRSNFNPVNRRVFHDRFFFRSLLVTFLLVSISLLSTEAQPNLVLSKPSSTKHYYYQVGDRIYFKDNKSGKRFSGIIVSLNDSTFQLDRTVKFNIENIGTIYKTRHFLAQAAGAGIVVLGIYFPMGVLSRALQQQTPLIDDDMLLVNGTMLAVSGLSYLFLYKKIKIGQPWKVQVLDFGRRIYD